MADMVVWWVLFFTQNRSVPNETGKTENLCVFIRWQRNVKRETFWCMSHSMSECATSAGPFMVLRTVERVLETRKT